MNKVAILVPGIMGSVLELNGEVIWPGSVWSLLGTYKKMTELMDPNLVATDVIRSVSISDQYEDLIEDLNLCGYREGSSPPTLVICPYDWRKDNRDAAKILAAKIDTAVADHGGDENCEVAIIAHSMGGLVSRYYLESGDFAANPGLKAVKLLITLGTPHRGSPLALSAAIGLEKRVFLSAKQVQVLVNDARYPALYQLMPPPGEPFAWNEDRKTEFEVMDVYDPTLAAALNLNADNLKAAKEFHSALDMSKRPLYKGKPVRYFFFAGTRQTTISAVTLLNTGGTNYRLRKTELEDSGDGTVPGWSSGITGIQGQTVGGEHSVIYRNDLLRRTMGVLLGKAGVLKATPLKVEVAIRERVVYPNDIVHVALTFGAGVDKLDGRLDIQIAKLDENGEKIAFSNPVSSHVISYAGLNAEKLNVIFNAPAIPGFYRVAYFPTGGAEPAGKDELFVQEQLLDPNP